MIWRQFNINGNYIHPFWGFVNLKYGRGESVIKGQSGGGWKVPQSPPLTPGHLYCSCYSGSQKPELWRKKLILGFFGQVGHGSMLLVSLCGVKEEEDGWNSTAGNLSWRDVRNFWDPKIPALFCSEGGGVRWTDWLEIVLTERMLQNWLSGGEIVACWKLSTFCTLNWALNWTEFCSAISLVVVV